MRVGSMNRRKLSSKIVSKSSVGVKPAATSVATIAPADVPARFGCKSLAVQHRICADQSDAQDTAALEDQVYLLGDVPLCDNGIDLRHGLRADLLRLHHGRL